MKRAKPIQRKTRLKSVNRERAAKRKARDFGEYAEWIRTLPCCVRGRTYEAWYPDFPAEGHRVWAHLCSGDVEAHHLRSRGAGGHSNGNLLPLCRRAHMEWHLWGRKTWAKRYDLDPGAINSFAADLWGRYQTEKGNAA